MLLRRRFVTGVCAAAALLPPLLWLLPAFLNRLAPTLRDQGDFFYPLKLYTADRLRAGGLPLWNPLSGTGEPWLANGQSGVLYPPTLLFALPGAALAGGLYLLLHFAVLAWGGWRFLKEEGVSDAGALLGTATLAVSGFAVSLSVYWNHFAAFAFLPAIAALSRGGLRTRASVLGLGALIGLQAMTGSPEMSAASVVLGAALAWRSRVAVPEPVELSSRWAPVRRYAAALALGLALAAWVLAPMAELGAQSDRRHAIAASERDAGAIGARDLAGVAGFVAPWFGGAYLATLFLPPFALVAGAAAFLERDRRPLALLLAGFAAAGLLLAAAGPPGEWLRSIPPLDRIRYPAKALAWTAFGGAMLAGLGADALRFAPAARRGRLALAALSVGALATAALAPLAFPVRLASAVGAAAVGLLAVSGDRPRLRAALAGTAAAALVAALAAGLGSLYRFAPEAELRRCTDDAGLLARIPGRIVTPPMGDLAQWTLRDGAFDAAALRRQRDALLGYTNLSCRIPTIRTAAPMRTAGDEDIERAVGRAEDPLPAGAASGRVLWTPFPPQRIPSRKIGDFFRGPIAPYRPRLSFVRGYRIEVDPARAWDRAASGGIDITREVVLDRRPDPDPGGSSEHPLLVARLAEDAPERIVAELTANYAGLLVLTDLHYPGWVAEEGGRRLRILRADGWFRAVALGPGTHRVTFRYRPVAFYAGAAVSAATLLSMLVLWSLGEPVRRGRRA
ncbi:MAG TPA: hypothetical protein VH854_12030 [Thermoanaerobaculia bacterium]|nr:hypothetical protein [Thermoanaerobaculia bacterium]